MSCAPARRRRVVGRAAPPGGRSAAVPRGKFQATGRRLGNPTGYPTERSAVRCIFYKGPVSFTGGDSVVSCRRVYGFAQSPEPCVTSNLTRNTMALGVTLLLGERHRHAHAHERLEHDHVHVHDEHHRHEHDDGVPGEQPHAHPHVHTPLTHAHTHVSDVHHRHRHLATSPRAMEPGGRARALTCRARGSLWQRRGGAG